MLDELIRRGDVLDILMKYPNTPKGVFEAVCRMASQTTPQALRASSPLHGGALGAAEDPGAVETAAPGSDGWTSAYVSPLCADCANLEEDTLCCSMTGETLELAAGAKEKVYCLDWFPRGVEKE